MPRPPSRSLSIVVCVARSSATHRCLDRRWYRL